MRYGGDVQKHDLIKALPIKPQGDKTNQHAFRVMQEYQDWFADKSELIMLYLLGLFDQPIEIEVLEQLQQAQIPALTENLTQDDFQDGLYKLREDYQILSQHPERQDLIDCHPLIREYFGEQLQKQQPQAWQSAHKKLYDYYKALPKKHQPDTLEDMRPLFAAVAHGCAAGLHQQALDEVYYRRIRRNAQMDYLSKRLGRISDNLATVAYFFDLPWDRLSQKLSFCDQGVLFCTVGFNLHSLGRLHAALEPASIAVDIFLKQNNWSQAAITADMLSDLQLHLGNLVNAVQTAKQSVSYADKSGNWFHQVARMTAYANALHQIGQIENSRSLFERAIQIQRLNTGTIFGLESLQGFQYLDLLLEIGQMDFVQNEVCKVLNSGSSNLLGIALYKIIGGHASLQQNWPQAEDWLEQAVDGLRASGYDYYLPLGLFARAAIYRLKQDFAKAQQDLQEVYDIAQPSDMRLHLTDYHLESARLGLAANWPDDEIKTHIKAAAELIEDTGYHRRDAELTELQKQINRG